MNNVLIHLGMGFMLFGAILNGVRVIEYNNKKDGFGTWFHLFISLAMCIVFAFMIKKGM